MVISMVRTCFTSSLFKNQRLSSVFMQISEEGEGRREGEGGGGAAMDSFPRVWRKALVDQFLDDLLSRLLRLGFFAFGLVRAISSSVT